MNLQQYLQALRKFWWAIAVLTLLGAGYGVYSASRTVPQHRASVTFFVVTATTDSSVSAAVQGDQFAQRRVNSYVALLSQDRLAEMVADTPGLDLTPRQVRRMISGSGDIDTVLLTATVTSTIESRALRVAEVVATDFVQLVDEIEGGGEGSPSVRLEVVSGPSVRELPTRKVLTVGFPAFWGLLAGLGLALLLELRDNTVRSEDQLRSLAPVPVLGRIPFDRKVANLPLIVDVGPRSLFAESFRQLRTNLQFIDLERPLQVLVVTSSLPGEGKSVTSANLALSLVVAGHRTLVVEADFRRPMVASHFNVDRTVGLTDVLVGRAELDDVLHQWGNGLAVLPSGYLPPNPSELLGSDVMRRLLDVLRERFDVVVIDTPPLLPVTDGAVAAAHADGVLLAVRTGKTTRHQIEYSVRALDAVGATLLGTVMTMTPTGRGSEYQAYEDAYRAGTPANRLRRPVGAASAVPTSPSGDAAKS